MTILTIAEKDAKELDGAKSLQTLAARARRILETVPPRSTLLIPNFLAAPASVALVLRARAKSIVPVWWNGAEYLRFPREV